MTQQGVGLVGSGGSPHHGVRREITQRAVLEAIAAEGGPLSRAEIARRTSISAPTISEAVRRLEAEAVLGPVGVRSGYAGAVATLYDLVPAAGVVVAAELSPTGVRTAASDIPGTTLASEEHTLDCAQDEVAGRVDALVGRLAEKVAGDGRPVRAVVVSVANPVDPRSGSVVELRESAFPHGIVSAADIHVDPSTVVFIDNDVNLAAVAESDHGAAAGARTFVYLYVGRRRSLGLGVVIDGAVVRGAHGLAGEIGYLPYGAHAGDNPKFGLGAAIGEFDLSPDAEGGTPAPDALAGAGRLLGEAATAVCAIVDPELVVLGGSVGMNPTLLDHVRATVSRLAPRDTPVVASTVGAQAPLRGALVAARRRAWEELCSGPGVTQR